MNKSLMKRRRRKEHGWGLILKGCNYCMLALTICILVYCSHYLLQHKATSLVFNGDHTSSDKSRSKISKGSFVNKSSIIFKIRDRIDELKKEVKILRQRKVVMSRDARAIQLTNLLQNVTRCYLLYMYGYQPYIVDIFLKFPINMVKSYERLSASGGMEKIRIELAPIEYLPHAVFTFLEIVRTFKGGQFNRNAPHVLQSSVSAGFHGGVVFMEYDRRYPHEKNTLGFAGRGGGNAFYINTINNTMNHGPGTDRGGKDPEADTNFGKIIQGANIVEIMKKQPTGAEIDSLIDISYI